MTIVPNKTDSSKVYIVKMIDHCVTDALSYLHITSMLQDRDWRENPVPIAFSPPLSTWQVFTKWFGAMRPIMAYKNRQKVIERVGKGDPSSERDYQISGPIDLQSLKKRSKELDVTINELFLGSIVAAYSKLDLPVEITPSHFNTIIAVSIAEE